MIAIDTKRTVILMADGFEEIEAVTVIDILRRAGIICDICSVQNKPVVTGSHKIKLQADLLLNDLMKSGNNQIAEKYDAVILPGGMPGSATLRDTPEVIEIIRSFNEKNRIVAAICAAPMALERAGLTAGKTITSYPGSLENEADCTYTGLMVSQDKNIITGRAPGAAAEFSYKLADELRKDDFSKKLKKDMFFSCGS